MINKLKNFIARGQRGYSTEDTWNFHTYLCDIIPPVLRSYIRTSHGCPGEYYDSNAVNNECYKWDKVLEEIAQGFEAAKIISESGCHRTIKNEEGLFTWEYDQEQAKILTKKFERGMDLFKKHFFDLWD